MALYDVFVGHMDMIILLLVYNFIFLLIIQHEIVASPCLHSFFMKVAPPENPLMQCANNFHRSIIILRHDGSQV